MSGALAVPERSALRPAGPEPAWLRRRSVRERIGKGVVVAVLVAGMIPLLIPFYWTVVTSVKVIEEVNHFPPIWVPTQVTLQPYAVALGQFPFLLGTRNTLLVMLPNLVGTLLTASMAAFAFARLRWPGRDAWFLVLLSTMMVPWQVTVIPQFIVFTNLGWVDTFLPLTVPAFFGGGAWSVFLLRQFFLTLPGETEDAARIDGASTPQVYWHIGLPHVAPALIADALFIFTGVWNDLLGPLIYLNDHTRWTLQVYIAAMRPSGIERVPPNVVMAVSTLALLPCLVVFFLGQKYFIQGVVISGLKG